MVVPSSDYFESPQSSQARFILCQGSSVLDVTQDVAAEATGGSCTSCDGILTGAGVYRKIRTVLDIDRSYYLVTECTKCNKCKKGFVSWSPVILNQLNPGHKAHFPAVLTYRSVSLKCYSLNKLCRQTGNRIKFYKKIIYLQKTSIHRLQNRLSRLDEVYIYM